MSQMNLKECLELIQSVPSIEIGEQTHTYHCKSGKGNDKLYIKRVENGYLLFCHHCGERGYVSNRYAEGSHAHSLSAGSKAYDKRADHMGSRPYEAAGYGKSGMYGIDGKSPCYLPSDCVGKVARWTNTDAKIWILKYGIPVSNIESAGICWSNSLSSIIFPRYFEGNLIGYQTRKFPPDGGPKYLTRGDSNSPYDALQSPTSRDTVVLVEDYVSALKVSMIAPAFPLGGTSIKDAQLYHLLKQFKRFVIMLDNDNYKVKMNQIKLLKRLGVYSSEVFLVSVEKDPKEYSLEELKELLEYYV